MRVGLAFALSQVDGNRRIRICWPKPDKVCLQSGCGHCADSPTLKTIQDVARYAERNEMGEDFAYGLRHNWYTRQQP